MEEYTDDIGLVLINAERKRQLNKLGYDNAHDAKENKDGQLVAAAILYATPPKLRSIKDWPWGTTNEADGFHPTPENRVKELTKAAALIAAEITRLVTKKPTHVVIKQ